MAKQTRYRGAGSRPSSGPGVPVIPLLGLVVLIGVAVFMARRFASEDQVQRTRAQEAPAAHVPFANVPDPQPPERRATGRAPVLDLAPEGLDRHPAWQRALELAEQGAAAFELSQAARAREDFTANQVHAREARDAYHEAIAASAEWMEDIVERYTEDDRQVRHIARVRDVWFQRLTALRRTTGR